MKKKRCAICKKLLEPVFNDWKSMQPNGGCELIIVGAYGSTVLDDDVAGTVRRGVVCDSCVKNMLPMLEQ